MSKTLCLFGRSIVAGLMLTAVASAQDIPTDPTRWINSPPLNKEMLAGKAAVFYFVEEGCPNCAKKWPGILEATAKFQGQPVMFVAVNSGSSRPDFEAYLRRNQVLWAAINDWDRSFEKQFGFEISLDNIAQVEMLLPDGSFQGGDWSDLGGSAADAVKTARWKVDPKSIPPALGEAWLAIEFGNYPGASRSITRGLSGKGAVADGAQSLHKIVQDDMTARIAAAQKSLDDGHSWDAFKGFSEIPIRFKGFEIPEDVAMRITELTKNEDVKKEQAAQKLLARARQSAAKSPNNLKTAIKQLQSLSKEHSKTEAGIEAQMYLDQLSAPATPTGPRPE